MYFGQATGFQKYQKMKTKQLYSDVLERKQVHWIVGLAMRKTFLQLTNGPSSFFLHSVSCVALVEKCSSIVVHSPVVDNCVHLRISFYLSPSNEPPFKVLNKSVIIQTTFFYFQRK